MIGSPEMDVWCSIIYYSLADQHQLSINPEPMVVVKLLVNRRPSVTDENLLMHFSGYISFLIFSLSVLFCVCGYLFPCLVESDPSVHLFIHRSVEQHDLNALQSSSKYAYNHFVILFLTPTCQSRKEVKLSSHVFQKTPNTKYWDERLCYSLLPSKILCS